MSLMPYDIMVGGALVGQQVTKDIATPDEDNFLLTWSICTLFWLEHCL